MRIGDDASMSPAGDMVAFAISLGLVIAALSIIGSDMRGDDQHDGYIDSSDLEAVSTWRGLDGDQDGIIEYDSLIRISNGTDGIPILPICGCVNLTILSRSFKHSIFFIDGIPSDDLIANNDQAHQKHSLIVTVDMEGRLISCLMEITTLGVND